MEPLKPNRKTKKQQIRFTSLLSVSLMATLCLWEQLTAHANDMVAEGYANAIKPYLHSATVNRCSDGRWIRARHLWHRERLAAILSDAVPIWKQPHCIIMTTAAAWELRVYTAATAARWQSFQGQSYAVICATRTLCCGKYIHSE